MKVIVRKPSQIKDLLKGKTLGFDIETSGKEFYRTITLMSFYDRETKLKVVVPIYTDEYIISSVEKEYLKEIFKSIGVVGHFLQFDLSMVYRDYGVIPRIDGDTFLLARMFQKRNQSIKDLFGEYYPTAMKRQKFKEIFADKMLGGFDITYSIADKETVIYSAVDAIMPVAVHEKFEQDPFYKSIEKVYKKIELPYLNTAITKRAQGLRVDVDKYYTMMNTLENRFNDELKEFYRLAGRNVKINSPADLRKFLFEERGLPITERTKTGNPSTSSTVLENLKGLDPVVDILIDVKHTDSVLRGSKKLPEFLIGERVHPTIEQIGYDGTSRVYSSDPSVNQYPRELRESIIPNEGKKFVYFDWSSAELYISAYWSRCKPILDWYNNGEDLHTNIAEWMLERPLKDKKERELSKVVSFGTIYGSKGGAIARALNISYQEGEMYCNKYLAKFHEIKELGDKMKAMARKTTYTQTIFGRKRKLEKMLSWSMKEKEQAERQAFNTAIQGSCSDFFKLACVKAQKYRNKGIDVRFGVFDSILLEVPIEMTEEQYVPIIEELSDFSGIFKGFKFRFSYAEGMNWNEAQSKA